MDSEYTLFAIEPLSEEPKAEDHPLPPTDHALVQAQIQTIARYLREKVWHTKPATEKGTNQP